MSFPELRGDSILSIPPGSNISEFLNAPKREFNMHVKFVDTGDQIFDLTSKKDSVELLSPFTGSKNLIVRITNPIHNVRQTTFFHDIAPMIGNTEYELSAAISYTGSSNAGHYVAVRKQKYFSLIFLLVHLNLFQILIPIVVASFIVWMV